MKTSTEIKNQYQAKLLTAQLDIKDLDSDRIQDFLTGRQKEQELEARIHFSTLEIQVQAIEAQLEAVKLLKLEAQYQVQLCENKKEIAETEIQNRTESK